jgi:hypothetical protein
MTKKETEAIIKCISLLSLDGSNTKKQAKEILIELIPNYQEK